MGTQRVILLEALNLETGVEETLGFSDRGGFMTAPTDTPPNTFYPGRIKQALNFEVSLFNGRTWWGASKVGRGQMKLANVDGRLDYLERYSFDGRAWRILEGEEDAPLAAFTPIFSGVMAPHNMGNEVAVNLRDRFAVLDKPLCQNTYAGTNSGPSGVEGGEDLKGKRKGVSLGCTRNATVQMVNSSALMLQFSDGQVEGVSNIRHNGASWTLGADYATLALLEAATVPAATVATCLAEGYGKAGSRPTGTLTADVKGVPPGGVYADTLAGLLRQLFILGGIPEEDLIEESFDALAAARPAKVNLRVEGDETILSACDRLCASGLAWFSHDEFGRVYVGKLGLPAGPAVATIENLLRSEPLERIPHQVTEDGEPAWRVTVKHARNWTVQARDSLAAVITDDAAQAGLVEFLGQEWRSAVAEDATVTAAYPNAKEIEIETCLDNQADAEALAAEVLAMFREPRGFWKAKVPPAALAGVNLGRDVLFKHRRYQLNAGRLFTVTGLTRDLGRRFGRIVMWG